MQVPAHSFAQAYNGLSPRDECPSVHPGSPDFQFSATDSHFGGKYSIFTELPITRKFPTPDAPPSDITSSDDEEINIEVLHNWPITRRVFGALLQDPEFPKVYCHARETRLSPQEWVQLRGFLIHHSNLLRYFWFDYDMTTNRLISGSPGPLHQVILPMIDTMLIEPVITPWMDLLREHLVHSTLQRLTDNTVISAGQLTVPDLTIRLVFRPKVARTRQYDFDLLSVENAHTQSRKAVLEKTAKRMVISTDQHTPCVVVPAETEAAAGTAAAEAAASKGADSSGSDAGSGSGGGSSLSALTSLSDEGSQSQAGAGGAVFDAHGELSDLSSLTLSQPGAGSQVDDGAPAGEKKSAPKIYLASAHVVVIIDEMTPAQTKKALGDTFHPPTGNILQELPLPDDCVSGGWAHKGEIYVGRTHAYLMAFQGPADGRLLMTRARSFTMKDWVDCYKALPVRSNWKTASAAELAQRDLFFSETWDPIMGEMRHQIFKHAVLCLDWLRHDREKIRRLGEQEDVFNFREPSISDPSAVMFAELRDAARDSALERIAKGQPDEVQTAHQSYAAVPLQEALAHSRLVRKHVEDKNYDEADRELKRMCYGETVPDDIVPDSDPEAQGDISFSSDSSGPSDLAQDSDYDPKGYGKQKGVNRRR
ncbi:uncharacterized protein B0H18DRAFT_1129295 [Fomitopsis serialis]|uniref:uncharacterized protein n=1 Tax=Fomitopsis serialis TaxID=139415 RepID=UPI0020088C7B|nr:uncharacterized protein B0H18DRAFT_1129295 [Neoantrodia serialis]KAH9910942.1 hypothetical protein B0H18DRAFT_1129295 [Neoantrodia serialis]